MATLKPPFTISAIQVTFAARDCTTIAFKDNATFVIKIPVEKQGCGGGRVKYYI